MSLSFVAVYRPVGSTGHRNTSHMRRRGIPHIVLTAPTLEAARRDLARRLTKGDKPENWHVMAHRGGFPCDAARVFPKAAPSPAARVEEASVPEAGPNVVLGGHILTEVVEQVRTTGLCRFRAKYGTVAGYVAREWGQNAATGEMVARMMKSRP